MPLDDNLLTTPAGRGSSSMAIHHLTPPDRTQVKTSPTDAARGAHCKGYRATPVQLEPLTTTHSTPNSQPPSVEDISQTRPCIAGGAPRLPIALGMGHMTKCRHNAARQMRRYA